MDFLKEYKDIKEQLERLEARKSFLETEIINLMDDDGIKEKATPFGHFIISGRRTWEYSPKVTALQSKLSKLKKIEEISSIAKLKKHSQHIRFTPVRTESIQEKAGE